MSERRVSVFSRRAVLAVAGAAMALVGCEQQAGRNEPAPAPAAVGQAVPAVQTAAAPAPVAPAAAADLPSVERGRYVVLVGGCNDCHTPGFMEKGLATPEGDWLTGVPVGWKGPWGTTYASNLRLFLKGMDEDVFVQVARARNSRPPMPWPNLHSMSDADLRSVYRFIRSLPVKGEQMPAYVPPGREPGTAYVELVPQLPKVSADAR